MLDTIAGMNHTVNVLRLKAGHIEIKKGVEDIFADLLDAEIEKQMDELVERWNDYKTERNATASNISSTQMAPQPVTNSAKAVETF